MNGDVTCAQHPDLPLCAGLGCRLEHADDFNRGPRYFCTCA
jgi:hypothetical protein